MVLFGLFTKQLIRLTKAFWFYLFSLIFLILIIVLKKTNQSCSVNHSEDFSWLNQQYSATHTVHTQVVDLWHNHFTTFRNSQQVCSIQSYWNFKTSLLSLNDVSGYLTFIFMFSWTACNRAQPYGSNAKAASIKKIPSKSEKLGLFFSGTAVRTNSTEHRL